MLEEVIQGSVGTIRRQVLQEPFGKASKFSGGDFLQLCSFPCQSLPALSQKASTICSGLGNGKTTRRISTRACPGGGIRLLSFLVTFSIRCLLFQLECLVHRKPDMVQRCDGGRVIALSPSTALLVRISIILSMQCVGGPFACCRVVSGAAAGWSRNQRDTTIRDRIRIRHFLDTEIDNPCEVTMGHQPTRREGTSTQRIHSYQHWQT